MNNLATIEINRTSDGTIATCIRQAQAEHKLWLGLDSNNYEVIKSIRLKAAEFAMTQVKVIWLEIWHDFIKSELNVHAAEISLCLTDNAKHFGAIPDDVQFYLNADSDGNEFEYKVPFNAYESFMGEKEYIAVNDAFDKYYRGL